jgi:hypothetical protein
MKKIQLVVILIIYATGFSNTSFAQDALDKLKIVLIRHGEKPVKGDNLTCQGLNRAMMLPKLLTKKFGIPDYIFVPNMAEEEQTKHSRMFQTVLPIAIKYNLKINSKHEEKDFAALATDIKSKTGTVLITWQHSSIPGVVAALGISQELKWPDEDYDSIWIITFHNGVATLAKDKENLKPTANCSF